MKSIKKFLFAFIILTSLNLTSCMGPGTADYYFNLSDTYRFAHVGDSSILKNGEFGYETLINTNITKLWWNDSFICAIQESGDTENYWIVNVNTDELLGPFDEKEFKIQTDSLDISKDIDLKDPTKYKHLAE